MSLNGCLGSTERGGWRGVGRKGWQRVGERLAKGWQRVGKGLAKGWQRVGGFPCTLQFRNSRGTRLETLVCDSMVFCAWLSNPLSSKRITKPSSEPTQTVLTTSQTVPGNSRNRTRSVLWQTYVSFPSPWGSQEKFVANWRVSVFKPYAKPYSDSCWVESPQTLLFLGVIGTFCMFCSVPVSGSNRCFWKFDRPALLWHLLGQNFLQHKLGKFPLGGKIFPPRDNFPLRIAFPFPRKGLFPRKWRLWEKGVFMP